jgi:hypothetical protein
LHSNNRLVPSSLSWIIAESTEKSWKTICKQCYCIFFSSNCRFTLLQTAGRWRYGSRLPRGQPRRQQGSWGRWAAGQVHGFSINVDILRYWI